MKIRTLKYIIYTLTGKIYIRTPGEPKYFKTLTEHQRVFVKEKLFGTKANLDKLIEGGDEEFDKYMHEQSLKRDATLSDDVEQIILNCRHAYGLLDIESDHYVFFCKYCLEIKRVQKEF